jgi:succinate dehydrogenase / fumarate reductase cytochrome b subunit
MSEELAATPSAESQISCSFWARKLHSLSGVLPIGAFLLEHFWTNSYAVSGPQAFNKAVEDIQAMPYVVLMEIFGIVLPILYHSFYGIWITIQGKPNVLGYKYARNWMYFLQRVTGVILLIYIGTHVYETRISSILKGTPMTFDYMVQELSEPGMFFFYLAGVLSAVFHFANGLWAFLIGWGITTTEKAMRRSAYVCTAIGLGLGAFGVNALLAFFGKAIVIHL